MELKNGMEVTLKSGAKGTLYKIDGNYWAIKRSSGCWTDDMSEATAKDAILWKVDKLEVNCRYQPVDYSDSAFVVRQIRGKYWDQIAIIYDYDGHVEIYEKSETPWSCGCIKL